MCNWYIPYPVPTYMYNLLKRFSSLTGNKPIEQGFTGALLFPFIPCGRRTWTIHTVIYEIFMILGFLEHKDGR